MVFWGLSYFPLFSMFRSSFILRDILMNHILLSRWELGCVKPKGNIIRAWFDQRNSVLTSFVLKGEKLLETWTQILGKTMAELSQATWAVKQHHGGRYVYLLPERGPPSPAHRAAPSPSIREGKIATFTQPKASRQQPWKFPIQVMFWQAPGGSLHFSFTRFIRKGTFNTVRAQACWS